MLTLEEYNRIFLLTEKLNTLTPIERQELWAVVKLGEDDLPSVYALDVKWIVKHLEVDTARNILAPYRKDKDILWNSAYLCALLLRGACIEKGIPYEWYLKENPDHSNSTIFHLIENLDNHDGSVDYGKATELFQIFADLIAKYS